MHYWLIGFFAVLSLIAVVSGLMLLHFETHRRRMWDSLNEVADAFRGKVRSQSFISTPTVEFEHAERSVIFDVFRPDHHAYLYARLCTTWPDKRLRFEIIPDRLPDGVRRLPGTKDIRIGSKAFDKKYLITGNDANEIRAILTPGVRKQIEQLRTWGYSDSIYVGCNVGQLQVQKEMQQALSPQMMIEFVQRGLKISEELEQALLAGIDYVQQGQLMIDSGQCQVCGEEIKKQAVYCRLCRTPHHRDCWDYFGACSTYGCGSKRFLVRKKKRR